jgi:hypothetical protein
MFKNKDSTLFIVPCVWPIGSQAFRPKKVTSKKLPHKLFGDKKGTVQTSRTSRGNLQTHLPLVPI